MTRIDFYILQQDSNQARMLFVCRLIDKALRQGNRIVVNVDDQATAEALDDLLWSFRPESYIPHAIAGSEEAEEVPVVISTGIDQANHHDVLINVANEIPDFFSRFQRMIEVVVQMEELLQITRQHYSFFKQRGYPLQTHRLSS